MASLCAASFGSSSASTFCSVSFVFAWLTLAKVLNARVTRAPLRSIASIVFANVGASPLFAIASISASCRFIPSSMAGL